ncbi:MAG: c-type cytochrome domain-containing protein [Planctomycetota bacterium]
MVPSRRRRPRRVTAWIGAVSAVLAATSGWLLATESGCGGELLDEHRWFGVGFAGAFLLTAVLDRRGGRGLAAARLLALALTLALGTLAGHHGGMVTHGANFLAERAPAWLAPYVGEEVGGARVARDTSTLEGRALAILDASCIRCHGPEKRKGSLRLDVAEDVLSVVEPGNAADSELFRRVLLPPTHPDFMPEGGEPLSDDDLLALRAWIDAGATLTVIEATRVEREQAEASRSARLEGLRAATDAIVEEREDGTLRVDFSRRRGPIEREALAALAEDADRVGELSLAGRSFDAATLGALPPLPALLELRVERTPLDGTMLALLVERAPNVLALNAHTTRLADGDLAVLDGLPDLVRVFLADTGVGEGALDAFRVRRPGVEVVGSGGLPPVPELDPPITTGGDD